ncbi:hypothetical protein [Endozoicomonas sp. 8E]|uniref:hypothetical protein n=1 Tax=Endozoicomonas sp. 8E TaxID=3035692 RepID=UPI0029393649|nr:hypothetical protein [Endozoicomonas sp. 8E]WOG27219.1 hypothetical protein P6910_22135 [Endozoicomonas sp. 8E]
MALLLNEQRFDKLIVVLIPLCVIYNAVLAFVNGNLFGINTAIVAATEIALLGLLLGLVVVTGFKRDDQWPIALLAVFVGSMLVTTLISGSLYVDAFRNILIISVCTLIGIRMAEEDLHKVFFILACGTLFFLLIEIISLETYVRIFQPALYYANTRGHSVSEFNELGIFNAALGFSSRFSFGVFSGPRTSSLFLEQTALGNFASILSIYLITFWTSLAKVRKIFFVSLITLILLSSDTRAGTGLALLMLFGYRVFPVLPKYSQVLIIPLVILLCGLVSVLSVGGYEAYGDTLHGRIILGIDHLFDLEFAHYLGWGVNIINKLWDSGFAYLVASSSIFGAITLWLYMIFLVPGHSAQAKRFIIGMNLYFGLTIVVSGNSVYSIKTATLLWVMAGVMYRLEKEKITTPTDELAKPEAFA